MFSRSILLSVFRISFWISFLSGELLYAEKIQIIESFDTVSSLDSSLNHSWEITEEAIDPEEYSETFINGKALARTNPYKVPGVYKVSAKSVSKIFLIKKFIAPENWTVAGLSVRLGTISDKDKTYLNGTLIGHTGDMQESEPEAYDKIRIYPIPIPLLRKGKENILIVEVKKYFNSEAGIEQDRTEIGDTYSIERDYYRTEYSKIALLMIYMTVGGYFLFLFVRRRTDTENLYFGAFTILLVLYEFLRNQIKYDLGISLLSMKKMEYSILTLLVPIFTNFVRSFFKFRRNIYINILDGFYLLFLLFYVFTNDVILYDKLNNFGVQFGWALYIIIIFYYLSNRLFKKDKDSLYILIGVSVVTLSAFLDSMVGRNAIVFPRTIGYTFFLFVISIATILANKFVRLNEQVEELNEDLEKKVQDRTKALNESLDYVNKLKIQQDGDYFLTSLLIQPLFTNKAKSEAVEIHFFSKQKKSIFFKNKQYEIGGDISISGNISIQGSKYTVFVNGDAMGKSIQGAGGALVMGTAFQSILSRTNRNGDYPKPPGSWLKESFLELQNIFESFDGSMYVSGVLGLLNEKSGRLYYINAEHPWPVLYRDGKAVFLDDELTLRKIGIPENENNLLIKSFQLEKGDVLIVGSDGKDDILIGTDKNVRMINEDETKFLRTTEKAGGNLKKIYEETIRSGELTDDFTLLRLEYSFEPEKKSAPPSEMMKIAHSYFKSKSYDLAAKYLKEISNSYPDREEIYLLSGRTYLKIKDYVSALEAFEKALELNPKRVESVYYASYCNKLNKNFIKAEHLGVTAYRMDNTSIRNLINLADIYKNLNQSELARDYVKKARSIDPNHPSLLKLADIF